MWTLSGFADEIDPDLDEQCELLDTLGIRFIELRSAWDTNVLDLDDDQVGRVRKTIAAHGISLSSVGCPGVIRRIHSGSNGSGFSTTSGGTWSFSSNIGSGPIPRTRTK